MTAKDSSGIAGIFFCLWRRLLCHRIVTVIVHAWFLATDRALWALVRLRGHAGQPKQGTGYGFFFLLFVLRVLARRVLSSSCSAYDRSLSRDEGKSLIKPGRDFVSASGYHSSFYSLLSHTSTFIYVLRPHRTGTPVPRLALGHPFATPTSAHYVDPLRLSPR